MIASGRGLHDRPVAEHTLALVLAAARRLHRAFAAQRDHEWATDIGGLQPEPSPGVFSTLRGARVTIWGFGSIGRTLEPHLTALGATVTGVARRARQEGHVTVIDESHLLDQLAQTDVLIMILPSTPATRGALNADKLAALPAHAWVINVGRGDAVDEPALMDALRRGRIAGAALDVTSIEPLPADSPLWDTPNLDHHAARCRWAPARWARPARREPRRPAGRQAAAQRGRRLADAGTAAKSTGGQASATSLRSRPRVSGIRIAVTRVTSMIAIM